MNLFRMVLMFKAIQITYFEKNSKNTFWLTQKSGKSGERCLQNETIQKWH